MKLISTFLLLALVANSTFGLENIITEWETSTGSGTYGVTGVYGIYYGATYVFIQTNSLPNDYSIGPKWTANPNNASAQGSTYKFYRTASYSSTKTETKMGTIGLWIDGVAIYNAKDGYSYNSLGVWNRNAEYWEGVSFDSCYGHPDASGTYHNHVNNICQYDYDDTTSHSPIIGYALDSYPIYGPFGYSSANDSSSSIKRMSSGYTLRSISDRTTLSNGTTLSSYYYGPTINSTYPLGSYLEDYYYAGTGDLDQYNGRWCVTPEYPSGTYAYFVATDSSGSPAYPFVVGPYYYGTVASISSSVSIPSGATKYYYYS